jgi:hypothetical protein
MKYIVIGILLATITTTNAQTQTNNEFLNLIKTYRVDSLPFCIKYSEDTKSSIENYDFESNQDEGNFTDEDTLNDLIVRKFFFGGKNKVYVQNLWSGDTMDVDSINNYLKSNTIYLTSILIKTRKFVGIVFSRDEAEGSEIYFCTFNKNGKLISKIQLAFYMHSGSYTNEEGGRSPWYAEKIGCIEKDFTINTDNGQNETLKYQILTSGKIMKIE